MSGSKDKRWLRVPMTPEEKEALVEMAKRNKRTPRQQASVYIRAGLESDVGSEALVAKVEGGQDENQD